MLVDSDHRVWFCGSFGDLPADAAPPSFVSVWPAPSQAPAAQVTLVACGFDYSVLVLGTGRCFAWGHNHHGQLGASASELLFSEHPRSAARDIFLRRFAHLTLSLSAGK